MAASNGLIRIDAKLGLNIYLTIVKIFNFLKANVARDSNLKKLRVKLETKLQNILLTKDLHINTPFINMNM